MSNLLLENISQLRTPFYCLHTTGFIITVGKRRSRFTHLKIVWHRICTECIRLIAAKVAFVQAFLQPSSFSKAGEFLGLIIFYGSFIPRAPDILKMFRNEITTRSLAVSFGDPRTPNRPCRASEFLPKRGFSIIPFIMALTLLKAYPSDVTVSGVLHQFCGQDRMPQNLLCRNLEGAQSCFTLYSNEVLAIFLAIMHHHHFFRNRTFHSLTDRKLC